MSMEPCMIFYTVITVPASFGTVPMLSNVGPLVFVNILDVLPHSLALSYVFVLLPPDLMSFVRYGLHAGIQ